MSRTLFIDTGAFYARYVARDQYHDNAVSLWKKIEKERPPLVTTNFVLEELVSLLIYRFGSQDGLQAAREIYASHAFEIVHVSLEIELEGFEWIGRFTDQKFSMTDACSFALMASRRLKTAFTFDHHFEIAGFNRYR